MFNWVCAAVLIVVMIIMGSLPDLVYWLPRSVLAGVVWSACVGLFPYEKIKEAVQTDTKDSYVLVLTMLCTTLWGIFEGIEMGFVVSILLLVQRSSKPHCTVLGRIPNTVEYDNIVSWPNAITTPGIVIFRFGEALHFGTVNYFHRAIQVLIQRYHNIEGKPLRYFILDCSAINDMDSSGLIAIENTWKHLRQNQIILLFAELKYPVIKLLKRSRFLQAIGLHHFFHNVFQAHMHIFIRLCFYRKLPFPTFSKTSPFHFDYIDPKGTNLIHFDKVDLSALDKSLTDDEQALVEKQDPFGFSTQTHPLSIEKKGFELRPRPFHVSLAPKSELIPLRSIHSATATNSFTNGH
ncbi:sulfate permease [Reticulomyxa filosa]|uniref:Sulfate permease n=1 Tax=Reticulomyxa filosa TaxID=46433 RepID=X6M9I4_RETFI|nr:sulfate permease [Reticulomyxa filosa]|eukprot:ETO10663.1 sulfate permease [Reticulomyxa filosa]